MAARVVLQGDQAEPADQELRGDEPQRSPGADLDSTKRAARWRRDALRAKPPEGVHDTRTFLTAECRRQARLRGIDNIEVFDYFDRDIFLCFAQFTLVKTIVLILGLAALYCGTHRTDSETGHIRYEGNRHKQGSAIAGRTRPAICVLAGTAAL